MSILHQAKEMRLPLMNLVKFKGLPILEQLHLEENLLRTSSENWCIINDDYVFGDRKFGGNAQSIIKSRWVHHTSFLWEYEAMNMAYLKQPSRAPMYRSGRNHSQFICGMKQLISRSEFIEKTHKALETQFVVEPKSSMEFGALCEEGFAHSTRLLTEQELENARASMI